MAFLSTPGLPGPKLAERAIFVSREAQLKILVTGSRDHTPEMELAVSYVLKRIRDNDHTVIVGDAEGIDSLVIAKCDLWSVFVSVYGAYGKVKRTSSQSGNSASTATVGDYLARDRRMAEVCDMCIAIWNCTSRGTKYTYDYCLKIGKPALILAFPNGLEHDLAREFLKL